MEVELFYFSHPLRNWSYVCWQKIGHQIYAYIIDPFDANPIISFLEKKKAKVLGILNTHQHWDHISGNEEIISRFGVVAHFGLDLPMTFGELKIVSCFTPGHCSQHYCYSFENQGVVVALFTGDLIFQGGVGRCMSDGDPRVLAQSIKNILNTMSGDVLWYPGHDYLTNNLSFSKKFDYFKRYIPDVNKNDGDLINNTLIIEKQQNIFLWCLDEDNWKSIPADLRGDTPIECFVTLRALRDKH